MQLEEDQDQALHAENGQMKQTMKDLSFALFMGCSLEAKYKNIMVSERNRKIMEFFARPISQVNQTFFKEKLEDGLPLECRHLIQQVQDQQEPIVDSFGRFTYFSIQLGDQTIPIYQPGSVMFETAVKPNSEAEVVAKGSQQNGAILGNGCALFLAKFLAKLVLKYNNLCKEGGYDF